MPTFSSHLPYFKALLKLRSEKEILSPNPHLAGQNVCKQIKLILYAKFLGNFKQNNNWNTVN